MQCISRVAVSQEQRVLLEFSSCFSVSAMPHAVVNNSVAESLKRYTLCTYKLIKRYTYMHLLIIA